MDLTSSPSLLICVVLAAALIGGTRSEGVCLQDGKHKATPSPEPHLTECSLYADNSCCTEEQIQDISHVPSANNQNEPWDKCGSLSPECEGFLKRVLCFYRCSPDAARWPHPQRSSYIQAVPLCHSFCHLCESLWGDAFMTVEDEPEEVGEAGEIGVDVDGVRPCGCLTLSPSDKDVIAALRAQQDDPEELDTTKTGLPQYRAPCQAKLPVQPRMGNSVLRKRSVEVEDVEGSGSGL
uniref:Retbindin n=1 Tax=Neolamprologus brichardi TaxID=32507 RepID=A0A3Q4H3Z1_NEOBR